MNTETKIMNDTWKTSAVVTRWLILAEQWSQLYYYVLCWKGSNLYLDLITAAYTVLIGIN